MTETTDFDLLTLQPPGAGLPTLELFIGQLIFRWQKRRATRASSAEQFARERASHLGLVRDLRSGEGRRRVLIPRPRGLEDSSRCWSAFMTLDHPRIVNGQIAGVIGLLGCGEAPDFVASTAAVKPREEVGDDVVPEFGAACDALEQAIAGVNDLHTRRRFAHSWFGELDAAGWHFLAGFDRELHRKQIESIRRGLREGQ